MKGVIVIFAVITAFVVVQVGLAEDLQPPWWRGEYSTTSQVWEFQTGDPTVPPDGPAPGGAPPLPSTYITIEPGPGMTWMEYDEGRYGVWPLSGRMFVLVDNHDPKPENEKWIWVQITWRPQDAGEYPIFENLDPQPTEPPNLVEEIQLENDWRESTFAWKLGWNPPDEYFEITGTINVDELVIDTWCVPEPASLSLLALGGLAMIRRRK